MWKSIRCVGCSAGVGGQGGDRASVAVSGGGVGVMREKVGASVGMVGKQKYIITLCCW